MIENHGRKRRLMCDGCDTTYDQVRAEEFTLMIAAARSDGWEVGKRGGGVFEHHCPDCRSDDRGGCAVAVQRRLLGL